MADDTTSVSLNGTSIYSAALGSGISYPTCANQPIGCLTKTEGIINLSSYLGDFNNSGPNTVSLPGLSGSRRFVWLGLFRNDYY